MVVMCYTRQEADEVFGLQALIVSIDMAQLAAKIVRNIFVLPLINKTLEHVNKFYPVTYGISQSAVH